MTKKSIDEKLAELNERPVPDETLTKAWWDLEGHNKELKNDNAAKSLRGHKERFTQMLGAAVRSPKSSG